MSSKESLRSLQRSRIRLHGAGRTDSGVHALGQVAHFDAPAASRMQPADWQRALNGNLPLYRPDPSNRPLAENFPRPRFFRQGKNLRYDLWTGDVLPPHLAGRAWHLAHPIDPAILQKALRLFTGSHDFHAFTANRGTPAEDTVRRVSEIRAARSGPLASVDPSRAKAFLYKMVRMLTGASVRVAQGRASMETLEKLLANPRTARWTYVAAGQTGCIWFVCVIEPRSWELPAT